MRTKNTLVRVKPCQEYVKNMLRVVNLSTKSRLSGQWRFVTKELDHSGDEQSNVAAQNRAN